MTNDDTQDLEAAAEAYGTTSDKLPPHNLLVAGFKAGAKWQREQDPGFWGRTASRLQAKLAKAEAQIHNYKSSVAHALYLAERHGSVQAFDHLRKYHQGGDDAQD